MQNEKNVGFFSSYCCLNDLWSRTLLELEIDERLQIGGDELV